MDNSVCPLDFRYGRKEVKDIFGEESKLQYLLDVEAALARAHAAVGNISQKDAKEITKKANISYVKVDRVREIEKDTRHDIMAVTRALSEVCTGNARKYIHLGATSYDIVDTANALQFAQTLTLLKIQLKQLRNTLLKLAKKHKNTVMPGRTHGQFSIPTTFGLKMAVYALEVDRHMERLHEASSRILVGKMSGAVGTGAALGKQALKIQQLVMQELQLGVEEGATQIVGRDRYIELLCILANIAASMEKFATEIRNLQRSEIGETAEAFETEKQVGSSTMPHKQNPILCEQVSGLARVVRTMVIPGFENAIQWHERDLCNSSAERFILPHALILTDWITYQMNRVFTNLKVYPERMQENLKQSRGLPMAESIMIKLVEKGMGRGDAHELMRTSAMEALAHNTDLYTILKKKQQVTQYLSEMEIKEALKPENYLGVAPQTVDYIVKKLSH
ncbi:MAG: adenylosuccinate lyase [Candidatus Thermoplasmatota archaeon]|nr:adenylosuccinate lyase [Candidatus Thermoplasmatota archaeon]MBU1941583.1 adenylosuccinate lyase [Candidatus Thermoplasmatota archaeon]